MSDYIDRQAYIASLDYPEPEFFDDFRAGWIYGLGRAEAIALNTPAADVAPVVHGTWTETAEHIRLANGECKDYINFYCSSCDAPSNAPAHYCPNCGARMEVNDHETD